MAKKYKVKLAGSVGETTEFTLSKGQRWMTSLSDYKKITRINPKHGGKALTISYGHSIDGVESPGKADLEDFMLWLLETKAEQLVVTFETE